jgi:hypothetical protein
MFITVRCRGHPDGKRFDLRNGRVFHVPLVAGGRRPFTMRNNESLSHFEEYVQREASKVRPLFSFTPKTYDSWAIVSTLTCSARAFARL